MQEDCKNKREVEMYQGNTGSAILLLMFVLKQDWTNNKITGLSCAFTKKLSDFFFFFYNTEKSTCGSSSIYCLKADSSGEKQDVWEETILGQMGDSFLSGHSFKSSGRATEFLHGGSSDYTKHRVHLLTVGPWAAPCYDKSFCAHTFSNSEYI